MAERASLAAAAGAELELALTVSEATAGRVAGVLDTASQLAPIARVLVLDAAGEVTAPALVAAIRAAAASCRGRRADRRRHGSLVRGAQPQRARRRDRPGVVLHHAAVPRRRRRVAVRDAARAGRRRRGREGAVRRTPDRRHAGDALAAATRSRSARDTRKRLGPAAALAALCGVDGGEHRPALGGRHAFAHLLRAARASRSDARCGGRLGRARHVCSRLSRALRRQAAHRREGRRDRSGRSGPGRGRRLHDGRPLRVVRRQPHPAAATRGRGRPERRRPRELRHLDASTLRSAMSRPREFRSGAQEVAVARGRIELDLGPYAVCTTHWGGQDA